MPTVEEKRLPKWALDKSIRRGNEFGWRQHDFVDVVEAARQALIGIVGGQVQYVLPDGTCELYWLSYDPEDRRLDEDWITYCNRTADECIQKFKTLIATVDIEKEALDSFTFLQDKKAANVRISDYLTFILYFDDGGTPYDH